MISFSGCHQQHLQSTNAISRPVLPPNLFNTFRAPEAAPLTIPPAEDVTLDKPSEALDTVPEAVSFAFEAASEVVEACLRLFLRMRKRDCRRTAREVKTAGMADERPPLGAAARGAGSSGSCTDPKGAKGRQMEVGGFFFYCSVVEGQGKGRTSQSFVSRLLLVS